ncbi:MAG: glycogen/starch synthase [Armatimonadota bacterium]|nr:glycogen/starch synthase [Armatimonadota bacterium]
MRILILDAVNPRGGWDFARALAKGLSKKGWDPRVAVLAGCDQLDDARINARPVIDRLPIIFEDGSIRSVSILVSLVEGAFYYLIQDERTGRRSAESMNGEDCATLVRGILAGLKAIVPRWTPDVVHINDSCPGLASVYLHALCLREWDLCRAYLTTVHSRRDSGQANTLVTGSGLGDEVRVVRCYKSPSRLASVYSNIYGEVLRSSKDEFLAA